ncbi:MULTISPECIES: hypothetical protein [Streptomyces]|uniref:Uncharacterized protein n=2 Tax=Streptomyces TaxID=1883 RepID=A0A2U9P7F4_STRAS|nr:hypothetical protein [Streptomyces actuosus]AWT45680.1 hypothetical protein DMT42_27580 [Streptomyces actuosus]MBM4822311.1 hypothetical protein [Streptomyces actuosus]
MNVLLCVACGRRLAGPVRRLDGMPVRPGPDDPGPDDPGPSGADGPRHGPASVPRGTYAVDPLPFGAPFVPYAGDDYDGIVPGGPWLSDERGFLLADGPRGTYVLHPLDVPDLAPHPDPVRSAGCCGATPYRGPNRLCPCGAEAAVESSECTGDWETRLLPDAVRLEAAP